MPNPIASLVLANTSDQTQADPPSSSDLATDYVAQSLGGSPASPNGSGTVIIPGLLHVPPGKAPSGPVNVDNLSAAGNLALWQ